MEKVTYSSLQGIHKDETIVVCGTGPSLPEFTRPDDFITIGVNDVPHHVPNLNYNIFVDPPQAFKGNKWRHAADYTGHTMAPRFDMLMKTWHLSEQATKIKPESVPWGPIHWQRWTQLKTRSANKTTNRDFEVGSRVALSNHSVFSAIVIALWMGAKKVGVIGMDFSEDHGLHKHKEKADAHLRILCSMTPDVEVVNLSTQSHLKALPLMSMENL